MFPRILVIACAAALGSCARPETSADGSVPRGELVPQNPRQLGESPPQHLLLTAEVSTGGIRVVSTQVVDHPMPLDRAPELAPWRVRLEDAAGEALFVGAVDASTGVRGEHHGEDGQIDAHHLATGSSWVTVRTPVLTEARTIRLYARGGTLPDGAVRGKTANADVMVELGSAALELPR